MDKLISLLEYSSLPAVAILVNVKHLVVKLIWIISILVLLGLSVFFIYEQFLVFQFKYEVTNSIIVSEETSQFPTVSICIPFETKLSSDQISFKNKINECSFESTSCNWTHFEIDESDKSNVCYRFNSGKDANNRSIEIRNISSDDLYMGFNLTLNLSNFWKSVDYNSKFYIYIDNSTSIFIPFGKLSVGERIKIPSGENLIRIKRTFTSELNCLGTTALFSNFKSKYIDYFKKNNKSYLKTDCLDLCYIEHLCDCEINNDFVDCVKDKNNDCLRTRLNKSSIKTCDTNCPSKCESISYDRTLSFLGHYFDQNKSVAGNKLTLVVYYPRLEYKSSIQLPKITVFDWIASVGGILGLFLGVGFYSMIEVLTILVEAFSEFISQKFHQSKKKQKKIEVVRKEHTNENSIQSQAINRIVLMNRHNTESANDEGLSQLKSVSEIF